MKSIPATIHHFHLELLVFFSDNRNQERLMCPGFYQDISIFLRTKTPQSSISLEASIAETLPIFLHSLQSCSSGLTRLEHNWQVFFLFTNSQFSSIMHEIIFLLFPTYSSLFFIKL